MRKILWIILLCLLLGLAISACGNRAPAVKEYSVTSITGLYDKFSLDAAETRALLPGTILIPADGATEVTCEGLGDIALCHVQVVETGEIGWVLSELVIENK